MLAAQLPLGVKGARRATIKKVLGTNPAAAAEFSETVPAGKSWLLQSVSVSLVADATGTPWPSLVIDDGTDIIFQALSGAAAQALSTTARHTWAPNLPQTGATSDPAKTGPLPSGLVLPAGYRIRSVTASIGGTDDYGAPTISVVEFSD